VEVVELVIHAAVGRDVGVCRPWIHMLGLCVVVEQTIEELVPVVVEVVVDADVSLEAIVEWRALINVSPATCRLPGISGGV